MQVFTIVRSRACCLPFDRKWGEVLFCGIDSRRMPIVAFLLRGPPGMAQHSGWVTSRSFSRIAGFSPHNVGAVKHFDPEFGINE